MKLLTVSKGGRYLATEDTPFFYLIGDTAWEMVHRLTREEVDFYLETRVKQGFNTIQTVVLAELSGLTLPNAYGALPLLKIEEGGFDPARPDLSGEYHYYDHLEYILFRAEALGLYIGLLPTWGDKFNRQWGEGPEIFTPENAFLYGKWLAKRVCHHQNIFWILGGDRTLDTPDHYEIIRQMAAGLKAGDDGKFLMTYHPCGEHSSSEFVHNEDFLDFNMFQSGHGYPSVPCYELAARDYALSPIKPVMEGEQCYEDHPKNFKEGNDYFDAVDVRLAAWRNLFSGVCGNTYGHNSVWGMRTAEEVSVYFPGTWKAVLHRPAAEAMVHYRDFIAAHDFLSKTPVYDSIENNLHDVRYVAALADDTEAFLYLPVGAPVTVNLQAFSFTPRVCTLFNPADGSYSAEFPFPADGRLFFEELGGGRGCDRVLILHR